MSQLRIVSREKGQCIEKKGLSVSGGELYLEVVPSDTLDVVRTKLRNHSRVQMPYKGVLNWVSI
jgi:hypothetical protein